ncbi:glycoside hydrolase superfamily [Auriculariales sp. MPI-PUGE-AT-0066]|nr:glycoside hydrolase superfamily [Auriculariales sp. MPI-PUGE-AT-0066]
MRARVFLSSLLLASAVAAAPAVKRQCSAPVPSSSSTVVPTTSTEAPIPTETSSAPETSTTVDPGSTSAPEPSESTSAPTSTSTSTDPEPTESPPPSGGGGGATPALAKHALFGKTINLLLLQDVSDDWDVINLSFGEPDTPTSGNIQFELCPVAECPNVESEADFVAAIDAKVAKGKLVQLSIGGEKGQVRLETEAARDKFIESVSAICDRYHLTGLDVDFEGQSISLDAGDNDFTAPTTPVIVNLIAALKALKAKYPHFTLTMAPETFFVQLGATFYGSGDFGGQDPRAGSFLPVIHAMRDDLTILHTQNYNSGPINGLDGKAWVMGSSDFHVAMADLLLKGFNVGGKADKPFPPLRPDQVGIGAPSSQGAGNGFLEPTDVQAAVDCLTKGSSCGEYKPSATYPDMRGVMTWSINWDNFFDNAFSKSLGPYLHSS